MHQNAPKCAWYPGSNRPAGGAYSDPQSLAECKGQGQGRKRDRKEEKGRGNRRVRRVNRGDATGEMMMISPTDSWIRPLNAIIVVEKLCIF